MTHDNNNDSFEDQLKLHKDRAAHYFSAYEAAQAKIAKLELDNNMYIAHYGDLERKYNKTLEVGKQRYEEITKLQEAVKVCRNDYWFMTNLLENYSANKEEAIKDCVERMKFRKPIFEDLSKSDAILGQEEK